MKPLALFISVASLLVLSPMLRGEKSERHDVSIQNMKFSPDKLEIQSGDTVVWINKDDRDHTVTANDGSFKSDNLSRNETFEHKFKKAGTFAYSCSYHPRMKATIIVKGD